MISMMISQYLICIRTLKSSYLNVIGKKKSREEGSRGPSEAMDVWPRLEMLIYICVPVYHDGRYCDECLREGACETDQIIVASGSCRGFHDGQEERGRME